MTAGRRPLRPETRSRLPLLVVPAVWFFIIGGIALVSRPDPPEPEPLAVRFAGADIVVVGDSLAVGAETQLRRVFESGDLRLDAVSGRPLARGSELDALEALGELADDPPEVLVIEIGTNDGWDPSGYDRRVSEALGLFPASTCIVWVTTQGYSPDGTDGLARINEAIVRQASARPNVHVADWARLIRDRSDTWHQPDGIHLTTEGSWGLAGLIGDTVESACMTT